ncbi:protein DBF4 homolog A isoform X2 [Melanerpes formicivorus]|uniref:protein DBF4 homolog A isoform X2 n=1 Tax=Melanerpes formicivorus TaxID=211600 RepID=UPI00358E006C
MKPSAAEAADRAARPPDGMQGKAERIKSALKSVKKDTGKTEKLKFKPLTGKVFYLDIPSHVVSEKIGKDLRELGGRVESFLSKDISYLVSNKKEAKFAPSLAQISPVPSPESAHHGGNSSSHPSNCRDRQEGSSFKGVDAVRMSRGKSLVKKAIKEQDLIPSGSILSNALSWGVKILHLDDVKNYIEQKKKELYLLRRPGSASKDVGKQVPAPKSKSRLKNPFVKVEDRSRQYRPFYLQFPIFPALNYCVPKPYSPFEVEKKLPSAAKQTQPKQRNKIISDKDCGTPLHLPQKDKKKRGYCECCGKKYEDLHTHLESEQHQNFAQSTEYRIVDEIISNFVYQFVEYKDDAKKIKRTKCSTGYFSPVLGRVTQPEELKERLQRQQVALRSFSWKDSAAWGVRGGCQPAEIQPSSLPAPTPLDECVCPVLDGHLPQASELKSKLRTSEEEIQAGYCAASFTESVVQPPPQRGAQACTETLPQACQLLSKEPQDPQGKQKDLQGSQGRICPLHSHLPAADLGEDKNLLLPKRKLTNTVVLPAKCLRKAAAHPVSGKRQGDLTDNHQQSLLLEPEGPDAAANKDLGELAAQSSPCAKLHRKVKLCLERNKRERWKQKVELCLKQHPEALAAAEEKKSCCSSPVHALLDLFQTSERNSEFGGFSGYTESKNSTNTKDPWEEQNSNIPWSLFSTSSSSPFAGF